MEKIILSYLLTITVHFTNYCHPRDVYRERERGGGEDETGLFSGRGEGGGGGGMSAN